MQIRRKIYYDKATGNVYVNTGERSGDVIETTQEQDFQTYTVLHGIDPAMVGVLQIPFGQDVDKFMQYPFHVDPATEQIIWDTGWTFDQAKANKLTELQTARENAIAAGFTSSADGTDRLYPSPQPVQDLIHQQTTAMLAGVAVWPQSWQDASGVWTSFTQAQFQTVIADFNTFKHAQWTKFAQLDQQRQAATTMDEVNAIAW